MVNLTILVNDKNKGLLNKEDIDKIMTYSNNIHTFRLDDEFITKYYKYIDVNQIICNYKFTDLTVLAKVMSSFPDMRKVVRYQKLDVDFINNYVLNDYYYDREEDVGIPEVIRYQTHLTKEEIEKLHYT